MTVIWGFNLSEMNWGAFGHKKMFDKRWHLRRERLIIYQLAMLTCLAAECTGEAANASIRWFIVATQVAQIATYSLSKYEDLQRNVETYSGFTAHLHNNDIIAAQVLTIVFCVFVATLFGADFFFLVFWPRQTYPRWYNATKKGLAVGITLGVFAAALMSTIVIASHSGFITGVSDANARSLVQVYFRPPLQYNSWPTNIAYVVLLWIGLVFTVASTVIMFVAVKHDEHMGTAPSHELPDHMADKEAKALH